MSAREAALSYARRGWSVFPLLPLSKKPRFEWKEFQSRIATEAEINKWFDDVPDSNIAVVTGKISGITVVDVDGPDGLRALDKAGVVLPPTPTVYTPHGIHFYYSYQEIPKQSVGILDHVDIRNDGGYVVAPPSVIGDGKGYVDGD
jgi:hypothetical protein